MGCKLMDIGPAGAGQGWLDLFAEEAASPELMHAMDRINAKYGRGSIRVAASGAGEGHRPWQMRQELRTPHYTTRIADIPIARA